MPSKLRVSEDFKSEKDFSDYLLESAPNIIVVLGKKSKIEVFNKHAEELLGYKSEEVIGKRWIEIFIPKGERKNLYKVWDEVIATKEIHTHENSVKTKSGEEKIISWSNRGLNISGKPLVLSVGVDITEKRKVQKKLEQLDKLKMDFVTNVSHELRTPITSIALALDLIDKEPSLIIKKEMFLMLHRNIHRLNRTVNNILDFSAVEAGKFKVNKTSIQINDIVDQVVQELKPAATVKHLNFIKSTKELPKLTGDKGGITRAIMNIVDNSIKFTDKGSVKISTKQEKNYIVVTIKDTGRGIKKADIPHIFEKFTKLEKHIPGTGVGLWITKRTIENYGGQIKVESKRGKGSTFTIRLPKGAK